MQYRKDKYGNDISILGYGCMRFSQKAGKIDFEKTEKEIMAAYDAGINYYDTAYIYGGSEATLGKILEKNQIRDKVKIATKLPQYLVKQKDSLDKYFEEQLKRLRTDYIDYYLMHMLSDINSWEALKKLGIEEWIAEKKASGAIKQVGFSYHGNSDMFCQLVDAYDWDFCQIQYNYLDENSQAGRVGLNHAAQKGIPVIIMEPLRGGRLVNHLPQDATKQFDNYSVKRSPAEWAFRWLWDQPEVTCVLSGMNSMEMVEENIRVASEVSVGEFGEEEKKIIENVVVAIKSQMKVGCTGCGYCMPCPKNVDIPGVFSAYNRSASDGKFNALREHIMCTLMRKEPTSASNCIECGKCEQHCPQGIEIRKELKNAKKTLEGPIYQGAKKFLKLFMKF